MIKDLLSNKTLDEKAQIKAKEIAKLKHTGKFIRGEYEIEIQELNEINGGVEVFARAWKNGNRLGFGKDGDVEIERFRIINPPILVPDGTKKTIVITTPFGDKEMEVNNFKEDPQEAIRQVLEQNIKLVGKENTQIIDGRIGKTTTTFYPSVDGKLLGPVNSNWATARGSATSVSSTDANETCAYVFYNGTNYWIQRGAFEFDFTALGTDTVSSAVLSFYVTATSDSDNDGNDYVIPVALTLGTPSTLATGDWANYGTTGFATAVDISGISTSAYTDWTLNASGLAHIAASKKAFGLMEGHDFENDPFTAGGGNSNNIYGYFSEQSGTTTDPKMVVTHAGAGNDSSFFMFMDRR